MKISLNWLSEYITCDLSVDDIASILTSTGLEVEGVESFESIKGGLKHFYIGEVVSCVKHPNADKLSLTEVNLGSEWGIKKIVCGAPNVATGQKVVVATAGAMIYMEGKDPFEIKPTKIRGEESNGMICAEDELGIGTSHDGILVLDPQTPVGIPAAQFFNISSDVIFEIGLTPNRTDAMSHRGVARDLSAALTARGIVHSYFPHGKSKFESPKTSVSTPYRIDLKTEEVFSFHLAEIKEMPQISSPSWMTDRLKAIGEHPKNILVDVTNYILHDLGQPLHAYDTDKLKGNLITIDSQQVKETFLALNGQKYDLEAGDIIIADSEKKIGLAGIMGSQDTAITGLSHGVLLEAAHFNGKAIRRTSQRLNLRSEASAKFEKGIDPNGVQYALEKAILILHSLAAHASFSEIISSSSQTFENYEVVLTADKLNLYANQNLARENVEHILTSLGIVIQSFEENQWRLSVPRFKDDVTREEDVIEEVLRIYGYNQLPYPKYLKSNLSFSHGWSAYQFETELSHRMVGDGFQEIITNSISQSKYFPDQNPIKLLNSMTSELDCMRTDILPCILEVVTYNLNRDQKDLRLYEIGTSYYLDKNGKYAQRKKMAILITGQKEVQNWQAPKGSANDFFQIKSAVEKLMIHFNISVGFVETTSPKLVYGLDLIWNQKNIGSIGLVKVDAQLFSIKQDVFYAELDLDYIYPMVAKAQTKFREIPKFPSVKRDLAMIVDETVSFSQIEKIYRKSIGQALTDVGLFDIFKGESIGKGKKSYAIRCTMSNPEKTMSEKEIDSMMQKLISQLQKEINAEIRS